LDSTRYWVLALLREWKKLSGKQLAIANAYLSLPSFDFNDDFLILSMFR